MDLNFLSQADSVTLKYELAKTALEAAKTNLEAAKQAYDELLAQADSHGIPKAKLKKLTEDRVQALIESGLLANVAKPEPGKAGAEPKRPKKTKVAAEAAPADADASKDADEEDGEDEPYDGLSLINAERNGEKGPSARA